MDLHIESYPEVDSTNAVVKRQIELGQQEGFVCRATIQTGGYGRQGRSWVSLLGGSYQSILLRPQRPLSEWPTLTLVVGLAVRRALLDLCEVSADQIFLKWPNDVMSAEGKLVGISCETHDGGVCIGIGVNVVYPQESITLPGKNTPAYVSDFLDDTIGWDACTLIEDVSNRVLMHVVTVYELWQQKGFKAFLDEYREANGLIGRFVKLMLTNGGILASGYVVDITETGQLAIEEQDRTIRVYSSGEVHLL